VLWREPHDRAVSSAWATLNSFGAPAFLSEKTTAGFVAHAAFRRHSTGAMQAIRDAGPRKRASALVIESIRGSKPKK
jgi:hypothetical protein